MPIYISTPIILIVALLACLIGTLLTKETDKETLVNFYKKTRPYGLWKPVETTIDPELVESVKKERNTDLVSLCIAVPWQVCMFMTPMQAMLHNWIPMGGWLAALVVLTIGLYFNWYKKLPEEVNE
jgi:hypothetical protein